MTPLSALPSSETTARETLRCLQGLEEFNKVRILVTGGLALLNHFPGSEKVEFLVFLEGVFDHRLDEHPSGAPDLFKSRLSSMHPDSFRHQLNLFRINGIQLQFIPKEILPYVPQGARTIAETREMNTNDLPYISGLDLFVYMVVSYEMSTETSNGCAYVRVITNFLRHLQSRGPVVFSSQQMESLASGLDWLTKYGRWDQEQWVLELGLD
ncbi:uncharacterized protein N7518_005837 [Penicillium psychrosexuale]|uniref:uncharacterized protein n=1 Tax=Penicillium psychrosexuale TaxID=1002107 RepID=UPI002545235D|nr:uncharacterized protein N7518_005837 [Penicillium psychrosexuale]KAJ5788826.1 hypothetical protein N7518_005837 [Penicillium psychrosexuale]